MFRTGSPYSPFFTSGFLSEPTASSSPEPSSLPPRRGSLPTDALPTCNPSTDESSAFYFTLQPKRDESEFRSFLSLDLAESQSLRSASLRRKASAASKGTSKFTRPSLSVFSPIPEARRQSAPLRVRMSRDSRTSHHSLRSIPSPKPAPSTILPDVPKQQPAQSSSSTTIPSNPPRLPSIAFSPSLELTLERTSRTAPPLLISRSPAPDTVQKLPKRPSITSHKTSSSVSTRVRKINRSDALARLEGRIKPSKPSPPLEMDRRDFMNMSDDEGSETSSFDAGLDEMIAWDAIMEPEDVVIPQFSWTPPKKGKKSRASRLLGGTRTSSQAHKPQATTKDWFPLKSFIDLRNDDEPSAWPWRSFIEVAGVS